jgi:hypothetical protein
MGFSQQKVDVKLNWADIVSLETINNMKVNYISFDGSQMEYEYGSLPVYSYEMKKLDIVFDLDLEIIDAVYDTLSIENTNFISDSDLVPTDFDYWVKDNGTNSVVSILPIKKDEISGRIILLKQFSFEMSLTPSEGKFAPEISDPVYSNESVLNTGQWFKMGIVNTGVHKIDWDFVNSLGLSPSDIDIAKIGIFGNYLGMLPEANAKERADDLQENSINLVGMEDGSFDEGDYILFYAQSQEQWRYNPFSARFDYLNNIYTDTSFYFFTPDVGNRKTIQTYQSLNVTPTATVTSFVDYFAHEEDNVNLMLSGKEWFGEYLNMGDPEFTFSHQIPNLNINKPVYLQCNFVARAFENTYFTVEVNDEIIVDSTRISAINPSNEAIYAREILRSETFFVDNNNLKIRTDYKTSLSSANAWINFFLLNFERELIFDGGQMKFRQPSVTALGNKSKFEIRTNIQNLKIWDITDSHNPFEINFNVGSNLIDFIASTDSPREYVIFDNSEYLIPVSSESVPNQNLHGISSVDFVIVVPDEFRDQAERLAEIHNVHDGLNTIVVSPTTIYNEFSSGSQDISAIRDFMRMLYLKDAFENGPGYLLLFGDGSVDYKHRIHDNTNFVPTFETEESLLVTKSFVSDDFFGLLDIDEGASCAGTLDIGIGRFPVTNIKEAKNAVDKVEHYLTRDIKTQNNWTKSICFIADDGDNNLHFKQVETQLSPIVDTLHPGIDIKKIYSDSYKRVKVPGGNRFPDVNIKLTEQVEGGALIVNYTGHGGLTGWSDELILNIPMIHSFNNFDRMPLFITATCEFSRFDNPEFTSAGEYMFLNENGGGIALITTTRLAYAAANIIVNTRIYNKLLKREDGSIPRLGDMVRMAKNPSSVNFLNIALLGDPTLRLAFPEKEIETRFINNKAVSASSDTISALTEVTVQAVIKKQNGTVDTDFTGFVYPKVYDKKSQYQTLGSSSASHPAGFELEDKVLYKGKSTVINGEFSFTFLVPKDISFNYGFGRISYYAYDTINFVDAWGAYDQIVVGGLNEDVVDDGNGPDISLFINSRNFSDGSEVENDLTLIADIYDENGISSTGNSLGRDIIAVIDNDYSNSVNLNESFNTDIDSYKKGSLAFELGALDIGWHTLNLKAWDLMNNSSTKTIDFYVGNEGAAILSKVYNYPNPFKDETKFTFRYNSNIEIRNIEIEIYDIRGQYVTSLSKDGEDFNNMYSEIVWNGTDHNGNILSEGIFLYSIFITDQSGNTNVIKQKMIKLTE